MTTQRDDYKPSSILELLIECGMSERQAWKAFEPVRAWFDTMGVGLAEALLPSLVAALLDERAEAGSGV